MQVVQPVAVPKGTPAFEQKREKVIAELNASIPKDFHLPDSFFKNPPLNVTSVPADCGILTPAEVIITEHYDATSLAAAIAKKQFSAVAVATAFAKRAAIAHQLTCCLTQYFMDEAIERAKYLDDYLARYGKTVGPLHGVPVSVKEHMAIQGHWSSFGYFSTRRYDDKDSLMIQTLRDAGAVFYVKTNQPQGQTSRQASRIHLFASLAAKTP
ncbi:Putative amidase signature domain-containing protein [Septoria linicola]|uniref:Amidase signature domain-containing protein n=1 Tax=Septoria linicola TaxID=215465 RepID=A0A9Q9EMA0_9PEZI|nr:Putative amidase signature domain-containing protein [Septoria linicola]